MHLIYSIKADNYHLYSISDNPDSRDARLESYAGCRRARLAVLGSRSYLVALR